MRIGLIGYSRAGKDTVAGMIRDYLVSNGHGQTKRLAFGDDLKERFYDCFPEAHGSEKPREWYESFGEIGRQIDPNMWIRSVEYKINNFCQNIPNLVLTDVRQKNEAEWCIKNGFILIEVWAPEDLRCERAKGDKSWQPINPSERNLNSIAFNYSNLQTRIFNMYDLENTKEQVEALIRRLLDGRN